MDRLFLDANVLFSAAYRSTSPLRRLWQFPDVVLLTSAYAAEEARRNLDTPEQRTELERLLQAIEVPPPADEVEVSIPADVELHPKDRPILDAALAALATHLLTGDIRHFGHLHERRVGGVLIVLPRSYFQERERRVHGTPDG